MKVILIGASGATGKFVLHELLQKKEIQKVTIFVRKNLEIVNDKLHQFIINFESLDNFIDEIDADVAISCLGTTLKDADSKENQYKVDFTYQYEFAKLAKQKGIEKFILLSSFGADKDSKIFYLKMKGELEDAISKLKFNSLFIVQPGPLIRPNSIRFGEKLSVKIIKFLNLFSIAKSYTPLHVHVVAKAILNMVLSKEKEVKVIDLNKIQKLGL